LFTVWRSLGASLPSAEKTVLHGLLVTGTTVFSDQRRTTVTGRLERLARVEMIESGDWEREDSAFHRSYKIWGEADGAAVEGYVDSSAVALITVEAGDLAAGFLERKIAIAGGESSYNLLVIAEGDSVTLADTSVWVFPDSFHPSGMLRVSIEDANADGATEVVVEAETIVSLQYLGATPLRWEAWLRRGISADSRRRGIPADSGRRGIPADSRRRGGGGWAPIFQYTASFATDEGDSYSATRRALDSSGAGFKDTVKVTVEHEQVTDDTEFRNTIVSFYLWNGSAYRKDGAQDLPKQGTARADGAGLSMTPGGEAALVETLRGGDLLYVFDRSDTRERWGETHVFWYRALAKDGIEGWVPASSVELSWIDPLKVNRETWLGKSGD
jgi:hypothetical protein